MTDRFPGAGAPGVQRWPADPAQFVDTTRCPACFNALTSSRCDVCGLDVGVPAAAELLAISTAIYEGEVGRQRLITRMRGDQAAREAASVAAARRVGAGAAAAAAAAVPTAADRARAIPSATDPASPGAVPMTTTPSIPVPAPIPSSSAPAAAAGAVGPAFAPIPPAAPSATTPRRSGVQVLLLTLGVVLISVTAVVFLFVAYLVASLEVRSVIIAAASVLVLGLAWLLRARRLPGTAEGVASVAVVLLLLDVWIVRANALFGTDALDAAAYTGVAFAIVGGVLAAVRAVSGIRVPGFAASGLAPAAAFLLGYAADPQTATGVWIGGLAAVLVAAVAAALAPRSPERAILLAAGLAGGAVSFVVAAWALPDLQWNGTWAFLAVGAAFTLVVVGLHITRAEAAAAWRRSAAAAAGTAFALAPAVGVVSELDVEVLTWLAPAVAGAVTALFAWMARYRGSAQGDARAALIAAGAVAALAAVPGLVLGFLALSARLSASVPAWQVDAQERIVWLGSETDLAPVLVPLVVAGGSLAVFALLGTGRRFLAIPVAAGIVGALVAGALAPGAAIPAAVFAVVGGGALALAATRAPAAVRGLLPVLATLGIAGSGLAVSAGYSNAATWPWALAAVLATAVAGRILARRVWSAPSTVWIGAAHLTGAVVLASIAFATIPAWLAESAAPVPAPWDSGWLWLGVLGAVLLAVVVLLPRRSDPDRIAMAVPALAAAMIGALVSAFGDGSDLSWLPAAMSAVIVVGAVRTSSPALVSALLAAAGPILVAVALDRGLAAIPGGPPAILGAAAGVLLAAAIAPLVLPRAERRARLAWAVSIGVAGLATLAWVDAASDQRWLLLLLLVPVPVLVASLDGDPIGGAAPSRHLSWLSLPLAVAAVWAWLLGDGVDDIEAYTLPLAGILIAAGLLLTWRRRAEGRYAAGRTALFATAAAIAVLPSVASSSGSELRTLILVAAGTVVALAASFLPDAARGVPVRLLGVATGWVALTGAALVRGSAIAVGEADAVPVELWPLLALLAGATLAVIWARTQSRPQVVAEGMLAASVVAASAPTLIAILADSQPTVRAAVLFPALAIVHVAAATVRARPVGGPILAWSSLGALVVGGTLVLVRDAVDPFDLVTASAGAALLGAGAVRMSRSPDLGSWPALGPGLAVLLLPPLVADFTDPVLWRLIALGVVAALAVVVGAVRRLQAPLLLGGAVLLVHAIAQLWPWITWLYEAVWWWLWLGIAGVILVALAATYERQLRLARGVVRSIGDLR